jgi:hypothetical protein
LLRAFKVGFACGVILLMGFAFVEAVGAARGNDCGGRSCDDVPGRECINGRHVGNPHCQPGPVVTITPTPLTPTPTATMTTTPTSTTTVTPTATGTWTPYDPMGTPTPTPTGTPTGTPTPSGTPIPTDTPIPGNTGHGAPPDAADGIVGGLLAIMLASFVGIGARWLTRQEE